MNFTINFTVTLSRHNPAGENVRPQKMYDHFYRSPTVIIFGEARIVEEIVAVCNSIRSYFLINYYYDPNWLSFLFFFIGVVDVAQFEIGTFKSNA